MGARATTRRHRVPVVRGRFRLRRPCGGPQCAAPAGARARHGLPGEATQGGAAPAPHGSRAVSWRAFLKKNIHFGCVQARAAGTGPAGCSRCTWGRGPRAHPVLPFPQLRADGGAWAHPKWSDCPRPGPKHPLLLCFARSVPASTGAASRQVVNDRNVPAYGGQGAARWLRGVKTKRPGSWWIPGLSKEWRKALSRRLPVPGVSKPHSCSSTACRRTGRRTQTQSGPCDGSAGWTGLAGCSRWSLVALEDCS